MYVLGTYFVCFFHFTDFDTCCWIEGLKRLSFERGVPLIVDKNLLETKKELSLKKTVLQRTCSLGYDQ
jgi:hypothetical protein